MLPEVEQIIKNNLPKQEHSAWAISSPDLLSFEPEKTLGPIPLTSQERLVRIQSLDKLAAELRSHNIEGLGLAYGSTLYSALNGPSQDLDAKLIIDPKDLPETLSILKKFDFQGAVFIDSHLQEQFAQEYIDAFRLRGLIDGSGSHTPFDLEIYNRRSLEAFLNETKYLVRMGLMTHETYNRLNLSITDYSLVVLLDGRRIKYPLYRWQEFKPDCVWLFDVKPVGNTVVDSVEEGFVLGINSVQNTLMESFPYYMEGEHLDTVIDGIRKMYAKFIYFFIMQNDLYQQNEIEISKQFCDLFVRRPRFSRDYYQIMLTRTIAMVRAVCRKNKIMKSADLDLNPGKELGSGFHSQAVLEEKDKFAMPKTVIKIFPRQEVLSESKAALFAAAIQSYRVMVTRYIPMPNISEIRFVEFDSGYKILLKEEYVGRQNLAREIQNGLHFSKIMEHFRSMLNIIHKIKTDSEEKLLTPMIELKPENLVRSKDGNLIFVDEFPPRFLAPWISSLWPTYNNPSLEWRQQKAVVHGDLNHVLRYLLLSFSILRDDLEPQLFLNEISTAYKWSGPEIQKFKDFISSSNESISPRRKLQAAKRGARFCSFFGITYNQTDS